MIFIFINKQNHNKLIWSHNGFTTQSSFNQMSELSAYNSKNKQKQKNWMYDQIAEIGTDSVEWLKLNLQNFLQKFLFWVSSKQFFFEREANKHVQFVCVFVCERERESEREKGSKRFLWFQGHRGECCSSGIKNSRQTILPWLKSAFQQLKAIVTSAHVTIDRKRNMLVSQCNQRVECA